MALRWAGLGLDRIGANLPSRSAGTSSAAGVLWRGVSSAAPRIAHYRETVFSAKCPRIIVLRLILAQVRAWVNSGEP